ncbi:MAG: helix-turn-helix transcriptional regulator [Lachnospiraceae bacterium]|nr:helix-turn-helix transcriptional regulator [Lachnospiraceae bacterium]
MEPAKDYNLMVGLRIREVRESLGLTREQFSIRCDISESFLTAVERGDKSITSKTLFKICTGANITPNYIILGSEKGYEMDIILELFNGLDQKYQPLAVKLLSAYVEAVNMPK